VEYELWIMRGKEKEEEGEEEISFKEGVAVIAAVPSLSFGVRRDLSGSGSKFAL